MAFCVTLICVLLGYPLSYLLSQLPERASQICMAFVLLPFWTSILVRTYAWLVLLQRQGIINNWLLDLGLIHEPLALVNNFFGTVITPNFFVPETNRTELHILRITFFIVKINGGKPYI